MDPLSHINSHFIQFQKLEVFPEFQWKATKETCDPRVREKVTLGIEKRKDIEENGQKNNYCRKKVTSADCLLLPM